MKAKRGICKSHNQEASLYAKGLCHSCYWREMRAKSKPVAKAKVKSIRQVSRNREEALRRYRRVRDVFLKENPVCQYPDCNSRKVTLHHAKGRIGSFLTNKKYFKALCWHHHQYIENHPDEAKRLGLSFDRLSKD